MPLRPTGPDIVTEADRRAIDREIRQNERQRERHRAYARKLVTDHLEGRISREEANRRLSKMGFGSLDGGGLVGRAIGDIGEVARGTAGMAVDYGGAAARDVRDIASMRNVRAIRRGDIGDIRPPFRHLSRQAAKDVVGTLMFIDRAIPESTFLPEPPFTIQADPENLTFRRGPGRHDPDDVAAARETWHEDPLLAFASTFGLAIPPIARAGSVGVLSRSLRRANPELSRHRAGALARRESRMPGAAAAHGLEGGIEPRVLEGEFMEAVARPWSRHPIGRAGQRLADRGSELLEARSPGMKLSTSQRAAAMNRRELDKVGRQEEMWRGRKTRVVGKAGRGPHIEQALIAAFEGPRGLTPRQAVETKIQSLKLAISQPRPFERQMALFDEPMTASPEARGRLEGQIADLERALQGDRLEGQRFSDALDALEAVSARAEAYGEPFLDMTPEQLAARKNRVAELWAEQGLLPEGVEPVARGYFPHRELFETIPGAGGAPTLAAHGRVVGKPRRTGIEGRLNELKRYLAGEVQADPQVLANTLAQRVRTGQNITARGSLYGKGAERVTQETPTGMMIVRDPLAKAEDLPPEVRMAALDPEQYARLVGREGGEPTAKALERWRDTWLHRPSETAAPEWTFDLKSTRVVPEKVVKTLLPDVFASAPRGHVAAIAGAVNSLVRATSIYLPYGGARYVVRNTPQNMILLALSQPKAFRHVARSTVTLRRSRPELYDWIKVEAGTVPAAAGLPELRYAGATAAQRIEKRTTAASRKAAGALGEISDEPWRVASWMGYANAGGFKGPAGWQRLRESRDPRVVRFRNDIAQRVREDMIDFDALSPFERETISRFAFIWPFVRGSTKWPFMYARERPVQASILSLLAAQHAREPMPGMPQSSRELGRLDVGGEPRDVGWLLPQSPAASTIERTVAVGRGFQKGLGPGVEQLADFLSPQYREAITGGEGYDRLKSILLPGFSTYEKIKRGGSLKEQLLRAVGSTVETSKYRKTQRKEARDTLAARWDAVVEAGKDSPYTVEAIVQSHTAYEAYRDLRDARAKYAAMDLGRDVTMKEKLLLLYSVARKHYPEIDFPPRYVERVKKAPDTWDPGSEMKVLEKLMFGPREWLMQAGRYAEKALQEGG